MAAGHHLFIAVLSLFVLSQLVSAQSTSCPGVTSSFYTEEKVCNPDETLRNFTVPACTALNISGSYVYYGIFTPFSQLTVAQVTSCFWELRLDSTSFVGSIANICQSLNMTDGQKPPQVIGDFLVNGTYYRSWKIGRAHV